jgi:hypothetical protein
MYAMLMCAALAARADEIREDYAVVKSIDAGKRTVTLDNKVTLPLPVGANIRKGRGLVATFDEIKVGMPVRVIYRTPSMRVRILHLDQKKPKRR